MSVTVEFGSKAAADQYRDDYEEYICPVDDDRRLKTVAFVSDTPDNVLEQAHSDAGISGAHDPRARDAAREQLSKTCDHAADHCEHGDPEACEFLQNACGYDEDEVATILDEDDAGDGSEEITGKAAGALGRAWGGYKGAITRLDREIEDVVESKREAEGAAAAINAIRRDHGQEPMEFERLEELSNRLEGVGDVAHDAEGHVELMERFS